MGAFGMHPDLSNQELRMSDSPSPSSPRRFSGGRVTAVIVGSLLALVSLGCFVAGGVALWANGQKDDDGYLSTRTERFHAGTAALRTENLDVDLGGTATVLDSDVYGKVRLRATPRADKDLFVGIARTSDVTHYLRGTAHTRVTDLDYHPFHADYATTGGAQRATAPATQRIWAAQAHGRGAQTLTWDVTDGDWSVVVMNADGSPGVDADVRAGANVPFLNEVAWGAIGTGAVVLLVSVALLYAGTRTPRGPRLETAAPGPSPAAA
jgi:hypothetical protein